MSATDPDYGDRIAGVYDQFYSGKHVSVYTLTITEPDLE